jgi:hypothetical protein
MRLNKRKYEYVVNVLGKHSLIFCKLMCSYNSSKHMGSKLLLFKVFSLT